VFKIKSRIFIGNFRKAHNFFFCLPSIRHTQQTYEAQAIAHIDSSPSTLCGLHNNWTNGYSANSCYFPHTRTIRSGQCVF